MIDWIDESGKLWGVSKRRIVLGGYWYDNTEFHKDGFSPRSIVAKLWDEREGAGQGASTQKTVEVFMGEALAFEIGMCHAQEPWFYLAHFRYVIPTRWMPGKTKMMELRAMFPRRFKDERAYYNELHGMHCYLLGRMPDVPRESNPAQIVRRICVEVASNTTPEIKVGSG